MDCWDDLIKLCEKRMGELEIPGAAIGIIHGDKTFTIGLGVTSVENPLPVTNNTLFQIGSTSKTFTGTMLVMLEEKGYLSLDDPVRKHLPDFQLQDEDTAAALTLKNLLNHSGGWAGDLFVNTGDGDDGLAEYVKEIEKQNQLTPIGETFHYNNSAFGIAGRVIEVVTGKGFEEACKEMIFTPLGMSKSNFTPAETMVERFAVGHYTDENDEVKVSHPWPLARAVGPIGRINSPVVDQLKYARAQLGMEKSLVTEVDRLRMQTADFPASNGEHMGISWFVLQTSVGRIVRHGGATNGQMSAFWMVPEAQFACTILTNHEKGGTLHFELTQWLKKHWLGITPPVFETIQKSAQELTEYEGTYIGPAFGNKIEIKAEGLGLRRQMIVGDISDVTVTISPTPPADLCRFIAVDQVEIADGDAHGIKAEFLRGPDGGIVWLRIGGRIFRRQV